MLTGLSGLLLGLSYPKFQHLIPLCIFYLGYCWFDCWDNFVTWLRNCYFNCCWWNCSWLQCCLDVFLKTVFNMVLEFMKMFKRSLKEAFSTWLYLIFGIIIAPIISRISEKFSLPSLSHLNDSFLITLSGLTKSHDAICYFWHKWLPKITTVPVLWFLEQLFPWLELIFWFFLGNQCK